MEAIRDNLSVGRFPLGNWEFFTTQQFLANTNPELFAATAPGPGAYRSYREKIFGIYMQDNVRVLPNLTVNLGARYEPTTAYNVLNGFASAFRSLTDPAPTIGNPLIQNPTLRDVNPRVGLAYPTGRAKTAVRTASACSMCSRCRTFSAAMRTTQFRSLILST